METKVNWNKLSQLLREKTGLAYFNSDKSELITRCLFNGDDHDNSSDHGHLYLSTSENFLVFSCFKCKTKGNILKLLDEYKIDPLEVIDKELLDNFQIYGKTQHINWVRNKDKVINNENFYKININTEKDLNIQKKILYIKGRTNFNINVELIPNLILNVESFLLENNIICNEMIKTYNNDIIGFLGERRQLLVLRSISDNVPFRYNIIKLRKEKFLYKDFYGIRLNSVSLNHNKIVLCEGPFDVLNVYANKLKLLDNSCYVSCVFGKSYYNSISSILDALKIFKVQITILSDKDVNEYFYYKLKNHPQVDSLNVYWNKKMKDFGEGSFIPFKYTNLKSVKKFKYDKTTYDKLYKSRFSK
jgi:hypothetical protein